MKIFKCIFYVLFTGALLLIGGCLFYINNFAREAVQTKLSEAIGQPVAISRVSYHFPFGLKLTQLSVGDFMNVDRIYLLVDPQTLLSETVKFTQFDLIDPSLVLKDQALAWREPSAIQGRDDSTPASRDGSMGERKKSYDIGRVNVTNGRLHVVQTSGPRPLKVELINLRGYFSDVSAPWRAGPMPFRFEAAAGIINAPFEQRQVTGGGWIDPVQKDLQSKISFRDLTGQDQLSMTLQTRGNDLIVDGVLRTAVNAADEGLSEESSVEQMFQQVMRQAVQGDAVRFETRFAVRDKLDQFRLDRMKIEFEGAAVKTDPDEKKILPVE